ncbi:MAG: hypothetical protein Q4D38_07555 [Planctomycetia bacterium]|nr:hypothetical protein [Planctomycetia bacterium]
MQSFFPEAPAFLTPARRASLWGVGAWTFLLVAAGVFLLVRRLAVGFPYSFSLGATLLVLGVASLQLAILDAVLRTIVSFDDQNSQSACWKTLLSIVPISCALALPSGSVAAGGAWIAAVLVVAFFWRESIQRTIISRRNSAPSEENSDAHVEDNDILDDPSDEETFDDEEDESALLPDGAQLSFMRSHAGETNDLFEGHIRAEFAPREQNTTVYIAFCPPFLRVPSTLCLVEDGSVVIESPILATAQGVRMDVKKEGVSPMADSAILYFKAWLGEDSSLAEDTTELRT